MSDPFDLHAYFSGLFICCVCGETQWPDEGFEGFDDICCRHLADKAKASGWYMAPIKDPKAPLDVDACYCPRCSEDRGLTHAIRAHNKGCIAAERSGVSNYAINNRLNE